MPTIWLETNGSMRKLINPSSARIVKKANDDWYIVWYNKNQQSKTRYRQKFGLNRIKNLEERQKWADCIITFINKNLFEGICPTPSEVEQKVLNKTSFNQYVSQYLLLRDKILSPNTLKAIRVIRNRLNEFAREVLKKSEVDWDDFSLDFPLIFQNWCYSSPRLWGRNYTAKAFQIITRILNDAEEQGVYAGNVHRSKKYRITQVDTDDIALEMEDIHILIGMECPKVALENVRDVFVFACLTGLRYSDFSKITKSNFKTIINNEGKLIKVVKIFTKKTDEKVVIPIHPIAQKIIDKHGGALPKVFCNQVFNRYLKQVCKDAGFVDTITLRKNIAGQYIIESLPQYMAISAHTARRTFATIAYLKLKMPVVLIMKITGHRTEKEFFKYIKISKEEAAIEMFAYFQTA